MCSPLTLNAFIPILVSNFKVGDEVYFAGALNRQGANAEYTAVDHRLVALKPNSVDHITASSMPLCALTAWEGFEDKLGIPLPTAANDAVAQSNASKSIIITAGAGGVGSIAIQLAKKVFKLGKVIAVSGRSESADWCRKMGADLVLDRSKDWKAQLEENGVKNGIHYALCVEVDDIFETLISILAPMGRICSVAVNHTPPSVSALFLKSISFDWEFMGSRPIFGYEVERHGQILSQLASLVDDGTITHWVGRTYHVASAETLRDGHDFQATGKAIGKIAYDAIFQ